MNDRYLQGDSYGKSVSVKKLLVGRWLTLSWLLVSGMIHVPNAHGQGSVAGVLNIGSGLELAIDPRWMAKTTGLRHEQKTPVPREVVMRGRGEFGYLSVLKDGNVYRMYHRTVIPSRDPDGLEFFCYLESKDAITWIKPKLNLFKIPGLDFPNAITRENKANPADIDVRHTPCISHNMRPFLDTRPGVPKSERFKALAGGFNSYRPKAGFWALVSADGKHWRKLRPNWVIDRSNWSTGTDSTPACCFWCADEKRYVAYIRIRVDRKNPTKGRVQGLRWIGRVTSKDFIHWSKVTPMKPLQDGFLAGRIAGREMHYYTNETQPYFRNPNLLLATPTRYFVGTVYSKQQLAKLSPEAHKHLQESTVGYTDAVLWTTRPGRLSYRQPFAEAFLRPGTNVLNWSNRSTYPHVRFVPTSETEMSFWAKHGRGSYAHVRRYTLRMDGFASFRAPLAGGELTTNPVKFTGCRLLINYSTSGAGSVRIEIQDRAGKPIKGFSLNDSVRQVGDAIDHPFRWKTGNDVGRLAGRTVRLRFVMHDADLYAFRFR